MREAQNGRATIVNLRGFEVFERDGPELTPDSIRAARQRAGLSQKQLAARLGTNQTSISRWERGAVRPRLRRHRQELQSLIRATAPPDRGSVLSCG